MDYWMSEFVGRLLDWFYSQQEYRTFQNIRFQISPVRRRLMTNDSNNVLVNYE